MCKACDPATCGHYVCQMRAQLERKKKRKPEGRQGLSKFEQKAKARYIADGWEVLDSGWPDFLLVKKRDDGTLELKGVEAKSKNDKLRSNQQRLLAALSTVLKIRIVGEGPGYGTNEIDMHHLIYYRERYEEFDGGKF